MLCDTAIVIITINPVNAPPIAVDDAEVTDEDTPVTVAVQTNDSDPDGDPITTTIIGNPTDGTATVINGDSISYTPNTGFTGMDTLTYQICDNGSPVLCDTAILIVSVNALPPCSPSSRIEFTLKYNQTSDEYEVYGKSDFSQSLFFVGGGSQISIVFPASLSDAPINITTVAGGFWLDNSQTLNPAADPGHDFHGIASCLLYTSPSPRDS